MKYDIGQISRMLADRALNVCEYLLPTGKRSGQEWECGSVDGDEGKSLKVNIGGKAGTWRDFASDDKGGDLVDLFMVVRGCSKGEAVREAKEFLGIKDEAMTFEPKRKEYKKPERPQGLSRPNAPMYDFFAKRGISQQVVDAFKVGMMQHQQKGDVIVFPYLREGELTFTKYRPLTDKGGMWTAKDAEPCLFGWQIMPENARSVTIVEGECFTPETEVFTENGWVKFGEYSNEKVFSVGANRFETPSKVIKKYYEGKLIQLSDGNRFSSLFTENHEIISVDPKGRTHKRKFSDTPRNYKIPRTVSFNGDGINLKNDEIALYLAICADSKIDIRKNGNIYCHFGLKKERKIQRLIEILKRLGIEYTSFPKEYGYTTVNFTAPTYVSSKEIPSEWVTQASLKQRKFIIEELVEWDGNRVKGRNQYEFSSKFRTECEKVQSIAHTCGYVSTVMHRKNQYGEWYKTSILLGKTHSSLQSTKVEYIDYSGNVHCVSVSTGAILVRHDSCIHVNGNCDALAMYEAGICALSVPRGGGDGAKQDCWIDADWERLQLFDHIFLALDNDEQGQKASEHIAQRLGRHRCWKVDFGQCKDANEFLLSGDSFQHLFANATSCDPSELKSAKDFIEDVIDYFYGEEFTQGGYKLPWSKLDGKFSLRKGEVTVWAGINGHGKSQVLGHVTAYTLGQGARWCVASMELPAHKLLARMFRQMSGVSQPSPEYCRNEIARYVNDNLYLFNVQGRAKAEKILEVFEYAHRRYGCDNFLIDSLAKCGFQEDNYSEQKSFVETCTEFAMKFNVHVHIVSHVRKGKDEHEAPDKMGIKGTGALTDMVDNVITVWRNKKKEESLASCSYYQPQKKEEVKTQNACGTISCCKQRHGEWEGTLKLWFDQASLQYRESYTHEIKKMA